MKTPAMVGTRSIGGQGTLTKKGLAPSIFEIECSGPTPVTIGLLPNQPQSTLRGLLPQQG